MKLQLVPARRGAQWVRQGFQVFFKRPLAFSGLFGLASLALLMVSIVPLLGTVVSFGAMPLMSLGFMIATSQVLRDGSPGFSVFWLPLKGDVARKRALLKLGLSYALCVIGMLALWFWLDDGRIASYRATMMSPNPSPEAVGTMLDDNRLVLSLFTPVILLSLISIPFWHAPALIHWGGLPAGKAVFFSTVACWRNRGAFAMYGLGWFFALMAFSTLATLFALITGAQAATVIALPAVLMLYVVFYASLYFSFADCFEMPPAPSVEKETSP